MMDTFFEVSRRSVPISKIEKTFLSWQDSSLAMRTEKGVHLFNYSFNLDCLDKQIDFLESTIVCPKDSPAREVSKAKFLGVGMRNIDYTEMIINPTFWPHNPDITEEMTSVICFIWSPEEMGEVGNIIAVLNSVGGVELFALCNMRWQSVLNFSPTIKKCLKYNMSPQNFEELKEAATILETSAICWAPILNNDDSCYFVTAQKDCTILIWKIFSDIKTLFLMGSFKVELTHIVNILFIPISKEKYRVICADALGEILASDIKLINNEFTLQHSNVLWKYKDKMFANNLEYTTIDNQTIFFCSKHRHLVVQLLDDNCNVTSQFVDNINDYRITCITNSIEGFYLGTFNVNIYKINIEVNKDNLNVILTPLVLKDTYLNYELHGISFSKNNFICAAATVDRTVLCRKGSYKTEVIFLSTETKLNSALLTLMNNPSNKLTGYWDCIETLRCRLRKTKSLSVLNISKLFKEVSNNVYQLKIYLIFLILQENMKKLVPLEMPTSDTVESIKEKILLENALSILKSKYVKHEIGEELTDIDKESLVGCKNYFEYYSQKYKSNIEIDDETLSLLQNYTTFVCQSCDENISGFTCKSGHLNILCMLSLSPITSHDYFICQCCGSVARSDLGISNPKCVFCDLRLSKNYS